MAADKPSSFLCPNCSALYRVVEVEVGPDTVDLEITCRNCGAPLASRKGNFHPQVFSGAYARAYSQTETTCAVRTNNRQRPDAEEKVPKDQIGPELIRYGEAEVESACREVRR